MAIFMKNTYLLLREVRIHNANAMSSPMTFGFPSMTAFFGFQHALARNIREHPLFKNISMKELAVSCHAFHLHAYKRKKGWQLVSMRCPLNDKGKSPAFVPEPRADLVVSLLINLDDSLSVFDDERDTFLHLVEKYLHSMRIAGGDILGFSPFIYSSENDGEKTSSDKSCLLDLSDDEASIRKGLHSLMPGFVLIERRDILRGGEDTLENLLDALAVHHTFSEENGSWEASRKYNGWLVPIAVGFKGLTPLGNVKYQRDKGVLHRFAEPILTLGEFKMPYHFHNLCEILWHLQYKKENLYLCVNCNEGADDNEE